jgi:DNA-binding NtrC family response regulator
MAHAVLIVEDEETLGRNLAAYLKMNGYDAHLATTGGAGLACAEKKRPDVVLLDLHLPDIDGIDVLRRLREQQSEATVILMTAFGDVETAVEAMKAGACDFLRKPLSLEEVKILIDRTIERQRSSEAIQFLSGQRVRPQGLDAIVGESSPIRELKERIARFLQVETALTDEMPPPVLISGETGTGKELVARAIHQAGGRRAGPFIELNCAALPNSLVEAELFGFERGSFTDAKERKIGLIEAADGGTLFLDEIGEMELSTQAKILKVMEDRMVRRVGGTRARAVDVRFIAATNRDLDAFAAAGRFREDLKFRLSVARFDLPPLRVRGDDVIRLAEDFLGRLAVRYRRAAQSLSDDARRQLLSYPWPGNVRELRNALERATLFSVSSILEPRDLGLNPAPVPASAAEAPEPRRETASRPIDNAPERLDDLVSLEREMIAQALTDVDWNVSKAARRVNLSRDQLRYRIEKFGLRA